MKKIFIIGLTLSLLFLFSNCTEEKNKLKPETQKDENKNKPVVSQPEFMIETGSAPVKGIGSESLSNFIPDKIPGTSVLPLKMGTLDENDYVITTVSREYIFSNKGFLKFIITDYGKKSNIPEFEIRLMNKPPEETGKTTQLINVPHGKGYSLWDEIRRTGSFYGLVDDRFILRIDGYNMPQDFRGFQDYIKYFKLDELVKYAKKN